MNAKCDSHSQQLVEFILTRLRVPDESVEGGHVAVSAEYAARHAGRRRFSPSLSYGRHFAPPLPTARRAAVMVLFEPDGDSWSIPLTVRPHHLPDHPGQVCLPGGRLEPGETVIEAAEREFCEELGLDSFPAATLGHLQSIYVYNSDFYLTPCLAVARRRLEYRPHAGEVESVIHLPIEHLLDLDRHVVRAHKRGRVSWTALGIEYAGAHVWGATAIVLGEVAEILR
ncbi:MAG: NUDIX hydrolase [Aureliella sp.]